MKSINLVYGVRNEHSCLSAQNARNGEVIEDDIQVFEQGTVDHFKNRETEYHIIMIELEKHAGKISRKVLQGLISEDSWVAIYHSNRVCRLAARLGTEMQSNYHLSLCLIDALITSVLGSLLTACIFP